MANFFQFCFKSVKQFLFRYLCDYLTLLYNETFAFSAADTEIGIFPFAGSVYDTAHNGYLYIIAVMAAKFFNLCCKRNKIDAGPSAGRTGNHFYSFVTKT